jgi:hypothetical protein
VARGAQAGLRRIRGDPELRLISSSRDDAGRRVGDGVGWGVGCRDGVGVGRGVGCRDGVGRGVGCRDGDGDTARPASAFDADGDGDGEGVADGDGAGRRDDLTTTSTRVTDGSAARSPPAPA